MREQQKQRLPLAIWALGFGSLLMDTSSELVHSLSPVLLVSVLGASAVTVRLIEGVAEGTAAVTKVFAGALSDYFRRRKTLIVLGYALAALAKPLFPLATSASWIFAARFIDRMSKGIRDAPRDALVADITAQTQRGAAYGLRQALDSVGAVLGPVLAVLLMLSFAGVTRMAITTAAITATERAQTAIPPIQKSPSCNADLRRLAITRVLLMEQWVLKRDEQCGLPARAWVLSSCVELFLAIEYRVAGITW